MNSNSLQQSLLFEPTLLIEKIIYHFTESKYPSLCYLCDNAQACSYDTSNQYTDHRKALECLKKGGDIAYVSLQDAKQFFIENTQNVNEYSYLCPNGTKQSNLTNPCVWMSQPWPVIIANADKGVELKALRNLWDENGRNDWQVALQEILTYGNYKVLDAVNIQAPKAHIKASKYYDLKCEI